MHLIPAAVLACLALSSLTAPLGIRHDVEEAEHLDLGARFPAVVQVGGLASGVLIAPDTVLTVAHAPEMLARMRPDQPLSVRFGEQTIEVARVVVPDGRGKGKDRNLHDIALLQLAEDAPEDVTPLPLHTAALEPGAEFVLAGWGILARGDNGIEVTPKAMAAPTRARRAGWNRIERCERKQGRLFARFDGEGEEQMELEAAPCIGDSGGPVLVRIPATDDQPECWEVAGVLALIDDGDEDRIVSEYGEEFGATAVAHYRRWIDATLEDRAPAPVPSRPAASRTAHSSQPSSTRSNQVTR